MARYRVKETSFVNGAIVEAGAEVEYDGLASHNLELLEKDEKRAEAVKTAGKAALVKEAKSLKAVVVDEDGTPTQTLINGSEDTATIQRAIQHIQSLRSD